MPMKRDNVFATPQHFDWRLIEDMSEIVVIPEISLSDLEDESYSPDDLRDEGHDVPEAEDEAFAYALEEFRQSDAYEEWKDGFLPLMSVLWPCTIDQPTRMAAAIRREALACTVVKGRVNGQEVSGIALTGGGMDLSDHLAAAYILCGQMPPVNVMEAALSKQSPKMEAELLQAAEDLAETLQATATRMSDQVAERQARLPRP